MARSKKPVPRWTFREFPDHAKPSKPTKVLEPRDKHLKGRCAGSAEKDATLAILDEFMRKYEHCADWNQFKFYEARSINYIGYLIRMENLCKFAIARTSAIKDKEWSAVLLRDVEHFKEQSRAEGFEDGKKLQKYAHCHKHGWNCDRCDTCIEDAKKKCEREFAQALLRDVEWARKDERDRCKRECRTCTKKNYALGLKIGREQTANEIFSEFEQHFIFNGSDDIVYVMDWDGKDYRTFKRKFLKAKRR